MSIVKVTVYRKDKDEILFEGYVKKGIKLKAFLKLSFSDIRGLKVNLKGNEGLVITRGEINSDVELEVDGIPQTELAKIKSTEEKVDKGREKAEGRQP